MEEILKRLRTAEHIRLVIRVFKNITKLEDTSELLLRLPDEFKPQEEPNYEFGKELISLYLHLEKAERKKFIQDELKTDISKLENSPYIERQCYDSKYMIGIKNYFISCSKIFIEAHEYFVFENKNENLEKVGILYTFEELNNICTKKNLEFKV